MKKWIIIVMGILCIGCITTVFAKGGVSPFGKKIEDISGEYVEEISAEELKEEIAEVVKMDNEKNIMLFDRELDLKGEAKDLIMAAGAKITSKALGSYAFLAATQLDISGEIFKDAFAVGNEMNVNGEMGRDFYAIGNTINISGNINRDVYAGGEELNITGKIQGDVNFVGGSIYLSSDAIVNGDLNLSVATVDIREGALILGTVTYPSDAVVETMPSGVKTRVKEVVQKEETGKSFLEKLKGVIFWIVANFLLFVLFTFIFPKLFETIETIYTEDATQKLCSSFGWGLLTLIVMPIVSILSIFTLIGSAIGIVGGMLYIVGLMMATVIGGYALVHPFSNTQNRYWKGFCGIFGIELFKALPLIGGWVGIFVSSVAFGTFIKLLKEANHKERDSS